MHALALALLMAAVTLAIGCANRFADPGAGGDSTQLGTPEPDGRVRFKSQIKPLLEQRCLPCHNGHTAAGDLDLRSGQLAFRRSPNGPFIVPGYPERSKLFRMIRLASEEPGAMPPTGHALSQTQRSAIQQWITEGAHWPEGPEGQLTATRHMEWRAQ